MAVERPGIAKDVTEVSFCTLMHSDFSLMGFAIIHSDSFFYLFGVVDWQNPVSIS